MADLIPAPDLELRDEDQLAAEAIARVSGELTLARVDQGIETWRRLRTLIEAGGLIPICPELTNANPSSSHTVVLEAIAWLEAFIARRINRLRERDAIEFHRLFKIELREATPATTTLEFTVDPPNGVDVTIPTGSQVSTEDGAYIFATNQELVIDFGTESDQVAAQRTVAAGQNRLSINSAGAMTAAVSLGVGTVPVEALHIAKNLNASRLIAKVENTNTGSGSRSAAVQFAASGVNWTIGTDAGIGGGNNFFITDEAAGFPPRILISSGGLITLGDLTSSYPALKRNGAGVAFRLGDDSGPASISVRSISGRSGAGAPSTSDIPAGEFIAWKNTTDATVKLYYNDAGTLKAVTLN